MTETERRACMGAPTLTNNDFATEMQECVHCGRRVAWDLVDHPFFGFAASCEHKDLKEPSDD